MPASREAREAVPRAMVMAMIMSMLLPVVLTKPLSGC